MAAERLLVIGGSGFVSGTLAQEAVARGYEVWAVTRGQRPLPAGVRGLVADRDDPAAFATALQGAGVTWDLAVDCIAYEVAHARQDLALLPRLVGQFVLVSTDFVFQPDARCVPQPFDHPATLDDESYGGKKRRCEAVLQASDPAFFWTVVRPCHIYGPGSQLGCLPAHGRDPELVDRLRRGEPLRLVGGGHFLQQPLFARDLAALILSLHGNPLAHHKLYCAAGPDMVESREYYRIIAEELGVALRVEEVPVAQARAEHPEWSPFLCHRLYDLTPLRLAGLQVPNTPLRLGLREHVAALTR